MFDSVLTRRVLPRGGGVSTESSTSPPQDDIGAIAPAAGERCGHHDMLRTILMDMAGWKDAEGLAS